MRRGDERKARNKKRKAAYLGEILVPPSPEVLFKLLFVIEFAL